MNSMFFVVILIQLAIAIILLANILEELQELNSREKSE